ncbi:MAG: helix-hairpin-helix domain-containing protein [Proteobacteria bacterium]|nr:helix-hairpin-helix domain-containing protein [Pseudomonadota bacterium]MCL2310483.1 helix-hairpin-helix domain-containing protein [Pseudomonadota bacterium]
MKKLILGIVFALFSLCAFAAVDINTASKEELQTLSGIGPEKAQAIVDYRAQHGPFKSTHDLHKVKGIGKKTVAKLGDSITASGSSGETKVKAKKEKEKVHSEKGHSAHHPAAAKSAPAPSAPSGEKAQ